MKRLLGAAVLTAAMATAAVSPATAVTNGNLDGNDHPMVGIMAAHDASGAYQWRCSGTLIAPRLFLTAGHCVEAPVAHVEIWFDADVESGEPGNGWPDDGEVGGEPFLHPDYDPDAFWLHDLGVVVLDDAVDVPAYGKLPALDLLDQFKRRQARDKAWFTAVGYGVQRAFPTAAEWKEHDEKIRMVARPKLIQIDTGFTGDGSLVLSNNARTGGTCFGDSGGPDFLRDSLVVAGVTSFGQGWACGGTGGVYRVDRADDLDWLATFMD
jgi:secreted trypsin-like serine protease